MSAVWFIGDTHFGHEKVITFEPEHRPFATIEEHDEELIKRWNDTIRPKDLVWHLGDVYLGRDALAFCKLMTRLNGRKHLVRGNHDTLPTEVYTNVFKEVHGVVGKYGFVMSHVPLHPESVKRWGLNVHGHLHSHKVMVETGVGLWALRDFDPAYYCVSVEAHGLKPVSLETIRKETAHDSPY